MVGETNARNGGGLLAPIDTREAAEQAARACARAFFVVAALQTVFGLLLWPPILLDAAVNALCAHFIRTRWSRTAAVIAMVYACMGFISAFMNRLGDEVDFGGGHVLLATLVVLVAARGLEATHKLHGRFKHPSGWGGGR